MKALASLIGTMFLVVGLTNSVWAESRYDKCDDRVDSKKGEFSRPLIDNTDIAMSIHYLAEKICKIEIPALRSTYLRYVTDTGCGHDTFIYQTMGETISKLETMSLREVISSGEDSSHISDLEMMSLAEQAFDEVGGCEKISARLIAEAKKGLK